jgi:hypothetical protein
MRVYVVFKMSPERVHRSRVEARVWSRHVVLLRAEVYSVPKSSKRRPDLTVHGWGTQRPVDQVAGDSPPALRTSSALSLQPALSS